MKIDERKKIKSDAQAKVSEVLAQADEAQMKAKLADLFNDMLTELAEAKSEKDQSVVDNTKLTDDLESLKTEKEELARQKTELEKQAVELQQKLEAADKKIEELTGSIESMKQEAALQARIAELEEAGLLSGGALADKQKARIKAMDDEEFAEHKEYLAELRSNLTKKLEEEAKTKTVETPAEEKKPTKEKKDKEDDEDLTAEAALAELADLDIDETKITATQLLKYKKAAAAFNVASSKTISIPDDFDSSYVGVDDATLKEYASLWEDEKGE